MVFVNSINGADGLIIDKDDNLWVAANQANEIVVVDKTGRAIANLALDLRIFGHPTVDSQWAADVKSHTIARIRARIPRISGLCKNHGHDDCD